MGAAGLASETRRSFQECMCESCVSCGVQPGGGARCRCTAGPCVQPLLRSQGPAGAHRTRQKGLPAAFVDVEARLLPETHPQPGCRPGHRHRLQGQGAGRSSSLGQPSTAEVQCESSPCPQCTPPSWPRSLLHWAQAAPTYSKPISCWFPASWAYGLGLFTVLLRAGQVCCRPAQTA